MVVTYQLGTCELVTIRLSLIVWFIFLESLHFSFNQPRLGLGTCPWLGMRGYSFPTWTWIIVTTGTYLPIPINRRFYLYAMISAQLHERKGRYLPVSRCIHWLDTLARVQKGRNRIHRQVHVCFTWVLCAKWVCLLFGHVNQSKLLTIYFELY